MNIEEIKKNQEEKEATWVECYDFDKIYIMWEPTSYEDITNGIHSYVNCLLLIDLDKYKIPVTLDTTLTTAQLEKESLRRLKQKLLRFVDTIDTELRKGE
jgi:hypothetical protein